MANIRKQCVRDFPPDQDPGPTEPAADPAATRRGLLMLGAISASAVVTIRPAFAQAAGSILNCEIPVPDPARGGAWIAPDGSLAPQGTEGAFQPSPKPITGEQVKAALAGRPYPGADHARSKAYTAYIKKLSPGQSGFTCFASLTMPRN